MFLYTYLFKIKETNQKWIVEMKQNARLFWSLSFFDVCCCCCFVLFLLSFLFSLNGVSRTQLCSKQVTERERKTSQMANLFLYATWIASTVKYVFDFTLWQNHSIETEIYRRKLSAANKNKKSYIKMCAVIQKKQKIEQNDRKWGLHKLAEAIGTHIQVEL